MYIILVYAVIAWIVFGCGIIHSFRALAIHKEKRNSGLWKPGESGSPTSNSRREFEMDAENIQAGLTRVTVCGTIRGCTPLRNDVIYVKTDAGSFPALILWIKRLDMPDENAGVRAQIRLTGLPVRVIRQLKTQETPCCLLTNLRPLKKTGPVPEEASEIKYPVVVTAPLREELPAAGMALIGLLGAGIGIWGLCTDNGHTGSFMLMLLAGLFVGGLGLSVFLSLLRFRLTADEGTITVRKFMKSTVYNVNNLRRHVHLAGDKSEKWLMDLSDKTCGRVASLNSRYRNYSQLLEVFRQAEQKRKEKADRQALYDYLNGTRFFVAATQSADPVTNETVTRARVMTHTSDGTKAVFLYDDRLAAQAQNPDDVIVDQLLSDLMPVLDEVDALLVWPSSGDLPRPITVTSESWCRLCADVNAD